MLVAITGANGFLGKYLSNYLEKNNINVRRIERTKNRDSFFLPEINEQTNWSNALKNVDIIVHCAAKAHILNLDKETINSIYKFNIGVTKKLAMQALDIGVKRFIYISSIKVFGEETELNECFKLNSKINPKDHYAISKLQAENALKEITFKNKMELVIIRPPLIYGPGVKANFLRMINYIYKGYPIPLGSITNKRSILFVGNMSSLILNCIYSNRVKGKTLLPTDNELISTQELILKIGDVFGKKPFLIKVPKFLLLLISYLLGKKSDVKKLINSLNIDTKETQEIIHWNPPFSLEDGLKETAKWFINSKN